MTDKDKQIINHDLAPDPADKAVAMDKIKELDQAIDYALAGFHVCVDKANKWNEAGLAYLNVFTSSVGLRNTEGDHVPGAKALIEQANAVAGLAKDK